MRKEKYSWIITSPLLFETFNDTLEFASQLIEGHDPKTFRRFVSEALELLWVEGSLSNILS